MAMQYDNVKHYVKCNYHDNDNMHCDNDNVNDNANHHDNDNHYNNGNGIAEDLRQYLFDPFVTTKSGGTGLGLALVAKIIGDHGGIIECESEPRRTVFRIMLPIYSGPDNPAGV